MSNKHQDAIKKGNRIYWPELDGLRFFAFLLVFIHHQTLFSKIPYLSTLQENGWIGVDLFFLLSAFLLTKILVAEFTEAKRISLKKFYARRALRIWPIYFLFIAFSSLVYALLGGSINDVSFRIIGLFTFSDNIFTSIYGYNPMPFIAHLWTITYEEQFYLFIPLVIPFLMKSSIRRRGVYFVVFFMIFNGTRIAFIANQVGHPAIWVLPITHFESIILGIVMGFGGLNFLLKRFSPALLGLLGIAFYLLLNLLPPIDHISYWLIISYTLVGLSTSLILMSIINNDQLKGLLSNKVLVFFGKRSYGLYVYHLLGDGISNLITAHIPTLPSGSLAIFIYSLSFTILASIISYKVIETPFLKLKKRFEVVPSRPI